MRSLLTLMMVATAMLPGCKKRVDSPEQGPHTAERAAPDLASDQVAARGSWIVDLAKDSSPLVTLAGTSSAWRAYFSGELNEAFEQFSRDAKKGTLEAKIGLARVALELAEAHVALGQIQVAVTSRWLSALSTLPSASKTVHWRGFLQARLSLKKGDSFTLSQVEGEAAAWMSGLAKDGPPDLVALLAGAPEGVDAQQPPGATAAYSARLRMPALVRAGRLKEAQHLLKKLDPKAPDFLVGQGESSVPLWDPGVAGAIAVVYAGVAHKAVSGLSGWPLLLTARAEYLMGQPERAVKTLDGLLAAKNGAPSLALLVISGALGAKDLQAQAEALRVIALHATGDTAAAKAQYEKLGTQTVAQRVLQSWAGSYLGLNGAMDAFPDDRSLLLKTISDEISALGQGAKGLNDVGQLMLVDRYVDRAQRRFADSLSRSGHPAEAVRAWQSAEDKRAAMAPSARNTLPALAATARDQVSVGQRRVALKYLSRMAPHLPAAATPAELLRDLLSQQAMQHGGSSATAGQ